MKHKDSEYIILDFTMDGIKVEIRDGWTIYHKNGKIHRDDGPAMISPNGDKYWYKDGVVHRDDGPAIIYSNRDIYWYRNGKLHRGDGPAVMRSDDSPMTMWYGTQEFWVEGVEIK